MQNALATVEELVATLERTNLATVLVEGKDDMSCYRWLETRLPKAVNIMQVGGRNNLFSIYKNRHKFNVPIAYVADKDLMVFTGIPKEYDSIVFTTGFSIENDVLVDSAVEKLFSESERILLTTCVAELTKWYAFEIESYKNGKMYQLDCHPKKLLDEETHKFKPESILPRIYCKANLLLEQSIYDGYKMLFRGKNLLTLYEYIIQSRENREPTYSKKALLEIAIKCLDTTTKDDMVRNVVDALGFTAPAL